MSKKNVEIDPEFIDVLIQSISVLSNVATLASAWLMLRNHVDRQVNDNNRDAIRQSLRILRRSLEDTFEAVQAVVRILEEGRTRAGLPTFLSAPNRFGSGVMLTGEELGRAQQFLGQLDGSSSQARNAARNLLFMIQQTNLSDTDNVIFDPDRLNEQLNSILFESANIGEALTKLSLAQQQAEDFVNEIERALRRN